MRNLSFYVSAFDPDKPRLEVFGKDKHHGALYISEYGDILTYVDGKFMKFQTEKGGYKSKYEIFRWCDADTGERKKVYISKLLKEKFSDSYG